MKVLLIEPLKPNLSLANLRDFGKIVYLTEDNADLPEPSLFDVDEYKEWLEEGLPPDKFIFVLAGSSIKIALMMCVLTELYEQFDVLMYDSVYRRYVCQTIKRNVNYEIKGA